MWKQPLLSHLYCSCNKRLNVQFSQPVVCCLQVVIKEKVLELLLYFTKHEEEEVKTKAIIGLGKNNVFFFLLFFILLGLTNKGHNIYHVQTVSHWVFPEINSMGCRVVESFSINKDWQAVLRFSSLASENDVDCVVVVFLFFFAVF